MKWCQTVEVRIRMLTSVIQGISFWKEFFSSFIFRKKNDFEQAFEATEQIKSIMVALHDRNGTQTNSHLVCKRKLNYLTKLTKRI